MSVSAAPIEKPPRRPVPVDPREVMKRHPGAHAVWKRIADNKSAWEVMTKLGANESMGTKLGLLYLEGHLSEHQVDAGRYFAKFCAAADHYNGMPRRECVSPAYEKGALNSRNDEEALALLQGTIKDYERRAQRTRRKWDRINGYFADEKVFSLLLDVCVHDQHCHYAQIPVLRAALELLVIKLGLNLIRSEDQPRRQPKRRRYRRKQGERNDRRRRDPSSNFARDNVPATAAVSMPQGGRSPQD